MNARLLVLASLLASLPAFADGAYVSCTADLTNTLRALSFINGAQKGAIQSAVAHDN